ncbi:MAG: phosphatidate cytidylyltransferase [Bilophila sp.]
MIIASCHLPRVLTGIALLLALGTALWLSGGTLFGFLLLFSLLGLWEFYAMFWPSRAELGGRLLGLFLGGGLLTFAWMRPGLVEAFLGISTVVLASFFLFNWARNDAYRFTRVAVILGGILYVPMLLLPVFGFSLKEQVFLLFATAASDTAAYFVGMRFGKHKIWPKVSPKKSVEGSLGGLLACVFVCTGFGLIFGVANLSSFILLTCLLGIMAQLGDFFESALKRSRSVKDSGIVLPGHGGVLDRIDSLLFVIPTYTFAKTFWLFF